MKCPKCGSKLRFEGRECAQHTMQLVCDACGAKFRVREGSIAKILFVAPLAAVVAVSLIEFVAGLLWGRMMIAYPNLVTGMSVLLGAAIFVLIAKPLFKLEEQSGIPGADADRDKGPGSI